MEAPTKTSFLQSELHKIPVVQKLKQNRGSSQLKKLTDSIQQLSMNQGQVIDNQLNQIYLLLLIKGEVELWWGGRSQLESKRLSAYGYQLVDKNLIKIEIKSDSWLCFLREKDLVQIFWGIINLPFINVRMCQLQRTQIFSHFEKRSLMKIAFDLQELSLKIGSTLILGEIHGGQAKRYCFYIISGQVKIIKQGKAVCMLGPNEIFGLDCLLSRAQIVQGQTRKGVVGKITTECAYLYKISVQSLSENQQNAIDCATKSSKWRETRFRKMVKIEESEKLMKRKLAK